MSRVPRKKWSALNAQELNARSSVCLLTTLHTLQRNGFASLDVVQWTGVRSFALSFVSGDGNGTVLAVKEDGTVWASDGLISNTLDPAGGRQLADLGNDVVAVAEGEFQTTVYLAIKTDGTVWIGSLYPSTASSPLVQAALPAPAVSVSVEDNNSENDVALVDGSVYRIFSPMSGRAPELLEVSSIKTLAAGHSHTCGLTTEGTVWCWGSNNFGQLGFLPLEPGFNYPRQVLELGNDVTAISAGAIHTCARRSDASIWCWGDNQDAQTTSSLAVSEIPTQVLGCQ